MAISETELAQQITTEFTPCLKIERSLLSATLSEIRLLLEKGEKLKLSERTGEFSGILLAEAQRSYEAVKGFAEESGRDWPVDNLVVALPQSTLVGPDDKLVWRRTESGRVLGEWFYFGIYEGEYSGEGRVVQSTSFNGVMSNDGQKLYQLHGSFSRFTLTKKPGIKPIYDIFVHLEDNQVTEVAITHQPTNGKQEKELRWQVETPPKSA